MKQGTANMRKIVLDKSVPNCYNMYMKKRWNVSNELKRIHNKPKIVVEWKLLSRHPLTWILVATLVSTMIA
jgi:hypothetical protein